MVEWRENDRDGREVRRFGCPGRRLRIALAGQIDNAEDLADELIGRRHQITSPTDVEMADRWKNAECGLGAATA